MLDDGMRDRMIVATGTATADGIGQRGAEILPTRRS